MVTSRRVAEEVLGNMRLLAPRPTLSRRSGDASALAFDVSLSLRSQMASRSQSTPARSRPCSRPHLSTIFNKQDFHEIPFFKMPARWTSDADVP